jgi:hypothetical protein
MTEQYTTKQELLDAGMMLDDVLRLQRLAPTINFSNEAVAEMQVTNSVNARMDDDALAMAYDYALGVAVGANEGTKTGSTPKTLWRR